MSTRTEPTAADYAEVDAAMSSFRAAMDRNRRDFYRSIAAAQKSHAETEAILDQMDERRRLYRWWKPWTW